MIHLDRCDLPQRKRSILREVWPIHVNTVRATADENDIQFRKIVCRGTSISADEKGKLESRRGGERKARVHLWAGINRLEENVSELRALSLLLQRSFLKLPVHRMAKNAQHRPDVFIVETLNSLHLERPELLKQFVAVGLLLKRSKTRLRVIKRGHENFSLCGGHFCGGKYASAIAEYGICAIVPNVDRSRRRLYLRLYRLRTSTVLQGILGKELSNFEFGVSAFRRVYRPGEWLGRKRAAR